MNTKSKLLTMSILTVGATISTAIINKLVKISATSKNFMDEKSSFCFKWRLGNIHYTKAGSGKPLLLIHDLNSSASNVEWELVIHQLENHYTVYSVDLLGCGRSEKPSMVYTNYLYVQMISDFIKSEIGHRTNVIATGESGSFIIMSCNNSPELFDQIMLVNPLSLVESSLMPGKTSRLFKLIIETPVIGTLLYHISCSKQIITDDFVKQYFYNPYRVKPSQTDAYYESSHRGFSPKSVYASITCNYTKCNITNSLKKINNSIYLIGGAEIDKMKNQLDEYKKLNPAIEITMLKETKHLPQLEAPERFVNIVKTYLN